MGCDKYITRKVSQLDTANLKFTQELESVSHGDGWISVLGDGDRWRHFVCEAEQNTIANGYGVLHAVL